MLMHMAFVQSEHEQAMHVSLFGRISTSSVTWLFSRQFHTMACHGWG